MTAHRIRVAVAGLGVIARTAHLPMLERRGDLFTVTALSDLSATALGEIGQRFGVPPRRRYADAGAMIEAGGFDAVLVLTSGSHGSLAVQALEAGLAVFCEKPLAYTRAEAERIAAAGGADPARLMVGYMKQYDPAVVQAEAALKAVGGPDAVHAVDVTVLHPSGDSQLAFAHLHPPADVAEAAAEAVREADDALVAAAVGDDPHHRGLYRILVNSVSHDLSLLRLLTGAPATVDHVATWRTAGEGEPSVEVTGALPGAGRYAIRWHYLPEYPAYREAVTVHHATGSLELAFPSPYLMNAPTTLTTVDAFAGGERHARYRSVVEAFEQELVAFHAMAATGAPPLTGVAGGVDDLLTSQRIVRRYGELAGRPAGGEARSA
jgi:predicted dehydrogenase